MSQLLRGTISPEGDRYALKSICILRLTTLNFTFNLLANGAHKAGRVVGLPQDCHHLTLHKFPAVVAGCAMKPLEVQGTQIVTVPHEEPALSHVAATNCTHAEKKQVVTELG